MLHLKKVLAAKPKEHVEAQLHALYTPWGEALDAAHVLEEHPTPQFARTRYTTLNGVWHCAVVEGSHAPTDNLQAVVEGAPQPAPEQFSHDIVVPFSPEALLSGLGQRLAPSDLLWYKRAFDAPKREAGERVLLHFQAVDYACAVYLNGQAVGSHVGGYLPFSFDISEALVPGENTLALCVADPSEYGEQLRGKQRFDRGDIWYSAQSGIWQTVWLEVVPAVYIESAKIEPDAQTGILSVGFHVCMPAQPAEGEAASTGANTDTNVSTSADAAAHTAAHTAASTTAHTIHLDVFDGETCVAHASCAAEETCALAVEVPKVKLWHPANPHLYTLRFSFGADEVESYCGFRSVEVKKDDAGHARIFLNGEPYFVRGVLDQGYWSDGLLTAPCDEALVFDIESMRNAGFNCLRKHIKVESERWYYHCDRLGMFVWQDMVSGGATELNDWLYSYKPTLFKPSWDHFSDTSTKHIEALGAGNERYRAEWLQSCVDEIHALANHPCIVAWTLFNEGWGQFKSKEAYELARATDPTRPICATSGWYDQGAGDIRGVHNYFRDFKVWKRGLRSRAFVISEFGGFAHHVDGHSALDEVYGYEVYDTVAEWQEHTRALLAEVEALEGKGLAGFILTQLSDIEEETNGILTYDRRINKLIDRE